MIAGTSRARVPDSYVREILLKPHELAKEPQMLRLFCVQERRCADVTMVMCDNDGCKFNNDRVCAQAKIYCVGRRCRSAKRYGVIDLMRKPDWAPKERDRNK